MCWCMTSANHCYECNKEFNQRQLLTPCGYVENGRGCRGTGETCEACTSARAAEEECQKTIYRQRPLNLDVKGRTRMQGLLSAFREDRDRRKQLSQEERATKDAAEDTGNKDKTTVGGQCEDDGGKVQEGLVPPSPLITERHQYHDHC
ncbi:Uu.00g062120.m01.CDS01 [Anthostomella pinea]|uniref:Uu.00g062120.m01.CDS01 n=1 Tax=Anthostomella pinea TaxID=933095 RepID=A0AAI8VT25_9PEZI|nr:Uu.00g062120.m01.CDS01 [Anthostomella pinea]